MTVDKPKTIETGIVVHKKQTFICMFFKKFPDPTAATIVLHQAGLKFPGKFWAQKFWFFFPLALKSSLKSHQMTHFFVQKRCLSEKIII